MGVGARAVNVCKCFIVNTLNSPRLPQIQKKSLFRTTRNGIHLYAVYNNKIDSKVCCGGWLLSVFLFPFSITSPRSLVQE